MNEIDPRDQRQIRIAKLEKLRETGIDPYPSRIAEGRVTIEFVLHEWEQLKQITDESGQVIRAGSVVHLAGRITALRIHGKSMFIGIADGTGSFQLYLRMNTLLEHNPEDTDNYIRAKDLDLGDFISATGELFTTRTGEPTLAAQKWELAAKTLLQLPEKYHGLTDPDLRLRQRYLDLLSNPEVKYNLQKRALIIKTIRTYLEEEGYIELETPTLTSLYGGAAARPFTTHHNALDIDLYLRIATELYLKRLIVGGFERIFEMGKVFRNEGIDRNHNPEFTLLELYEAFADYNRMMQIAEGLVVASAVEVAKFGEKNKENYIRTLADGTVVIERENAIITFNRPFERISFVDSIIELTSIDVLNAEKTELIEFFKSHDIDFDPKTPFWPLVDKLFSETVEPKLIKPTFVLDYPVGLSPLAKRKADAPELTERFELFIGGVEIANAFSELNDPLDQRGRMEAQLLQRAEGDEEAPNQIDEDFLTALEHGMPPTGGMGIGIGRLVTLLSGAHSLKEVIPFPLLKPKSIEHA
ncbi:lysine--tRNA ligase [bacterium]|nr:lysine--tRNA ligase [bacterium]